MVHVIILCGGVGSRLWPLSTADKPKQFLNLINDKSLIENSIERMIFDDIKIKSIVLVTGKKYYEYFKNETYDNCSIILEPEQKNTAASILLACLSIYSKIEESKISSTRILVIPSDHYYDKVVFQNIVKKALKVFDTNNESIITFGINPTYPETGYGYIKYDSDKILEFVEKPDISKATEFVNSSQYLWNSGIFMFNLKTIFDEYKKHESELYIKCMECFLKNKYVDNVIHIDRSFEECKNISFDYAIMERTKKGMIVKYDGIWTDIGDWDRLINFKKDNLLNEDIDENISKCQIIDQNNNISIKNSNETKHLFYKSNNCYINSSKGTIVIINIDDLIVVKNEDNILISKKDYSSNIKHLIDKIAHIPN